MEIVETAPCALLAFAGRLIKYRLDDVGDRLGIDVAFRRPQLLGQCGRGRIGTSLKVVMSPTISASDRQRWVRLSEKRTLGNASPY